MEQGTERSNGRKREYRLRQARLATDSTRNKSYTSALDATSPQRLGCGQIAVTRYHISKLRCLLSAFAEGSRYSHMIVGTEVKKVALRQCQTLDRSDYPVHNNKTTVLINFHSFFEVLRAVSVATSQSMSGPNGQAK